MGKFYPNVVRRDTTQNHAHALPDGHQTQGALFKPSKDRFGWHTHLYEMEGHVYESGPEHDGAGHVHVTELGDTSGPMSVNRDPQEFVDRTHNDEGVREDYIQRRGRDWFVLSESGNVLGKHSTKQQAVAQLGAVESSKARKGA